MSADPSLKRKTKEGIVWNSINQFGTLAISFVISTLLARLLLPEDFGLIAMILVITSLSEVFIDSGFKSALIQFNEVDEGDFSTIFFFNLFIGGLFSLVFYLSADWFASFYDNEALADLTRAISFMYVINSLAIVQEAKLTRELAFKSYTIIRICALIISGTVGITMALNDFGVWSLITQYLSMSILNVILLFFFVRWLPSLTFNFSSVKKFWNYSSYMLGNRLSQMIIMKLDIFIVGKLFQPAALGIYQKAKSFNQMPSTFTSGIITRTFFPIFSRQQGDMEGIKASYHKIMELLSYSVIPLFALLYLIAEDLVVLLFTDKWIEMVPLFRLFCLAGFLWPINALKINLTNALGHSDYTFKQSIALSALRLALLLSLFLLPFSFEIEYLIYIYIFVFYVAFLSGCYLISIVLKISLLDQVMRLVISIVLCLSAVLVGLVLHENYFFNGRFFTLIADTILFTLIYALLIFVFKRSVLFNCFQYLKALRSSK